MTCISLPEEGKSACFSGLRLAALASGILLGLSGNAWAQCNTLPGSGVSFSQVNYSFPGASGNGPSETGEIDVDLSALAAATGIASGFINVTTASGWVTQNLPVIADPNFNYPSISTTFDLGAGTAGTTVTSLVACVNYTPSPSPIAPSGPTSAFLVGTSNYNAEGQGYAVSAAPPPPPPGQIIPNIRRLPLFQFVGQPNHPNVQAANNQCGPAAAANSLTWLATQKGLAVPDPNNPGRGDPATGNVFGIQFNAPPNNTISTEVAGPSLVGILDLDMMRQSTSRSQGNNLNVQPQLLGILNYLARIIHEGGGCSARP
jgi:hypothetical protein